VFREPEVVCGNTTKYANRNLCLEQEGQRKFLVNPRLTNLPLVRDWPLLASYCTACCTGTGLPTRVLYDQAWYY